MLTAFCVLVLVPCASAEKTWDDPKLDVALHVPDSWAWLKSDPGWAKLDIVRGATRRLTGAGNEGLGTELHLAVRVAPAGMTLKKALADASVRSFLLSRFGASKPTVTQDTLTLITKKPEGEHPAVVLRAKGQAPDLKGKGPRDCTAALVVTLARGRIFLLRMYAFPTARDPEGLVVDLDFMEADALTLLDTRPRKVPLPPPKKKTPPKPENISGAPQTWRLVKHAKLTRIPLRPKEKREFKVLRLEDRDARSAYLVQLYEQPNVRYVGGVRKPATEIRPWISANWWAPFAKLYRRREIHTWKWPKKLGVKYPTFLTLPDFADEKQRISVAGARNRPSSMDNDAMRRAKCIQKMTDPRRYVGKKGKVKAAWRGCLQARDEKKRLVTELRYGWRTDSHTYLLYVTLVGDAHVKWGAAIRQTLESMQFER